MEKKGQSSLSTISLTDWKKVGRYIFWLQSRGAAAKIILWSLWRQTYQIRVFKVYGRQTEALIENLWWFQIESQHGPKLTGTVLHTHLKKTEKALTSRNVEEFHKCSNIQHTWGVGHCRPLTAIDRTLTDVAHLIMSKYNRLGRSLRKKKNPRGLFGFGSVKCISKSSWMWYIEQMDREKLTENKYLTYLVRCHKTTLLSFWDKEHVWDLHRARLVGGKKKN